MSLVISYLDDQPEYLPQLARWAFETWGHYNPSSSLEGALEKLRAHLNKAKLPLTFIALKDGQPVGMCSLRQNNGIRPDLAPWLGSLYVEPHVRKQGIGEELIAVGDRKGTVNGISQALPACF